MDFLDMVVFNYVNPSEVAFLQIMKLVTVVSEISILFYSVTCLL